MGMVGMVVVEYLGESMSKELLCKFPDNSAFDFDYSQSGIWSPLPLIFDGNNSSIIRDEDFFSTRRKLAYEDEEEEKDKENRGLLLKRVTVDLKKRITTSVFDKMLKSKKKMKMKAVSDLSPSSTPTPTPRNKGWAKILKVASKRFKKATTKKDPTAHYKRSNCLMMEPKF